MKVIFETKNTAIPKISIILLDWYCRESFHMLDYLNKQTVHRQGYEVIWIEYYDRQPREIDKKISYCINNGKPPVIDKWITMEMPRDIYYHKHLMYNLGIVVSRGEIVTFCDSDAIVKPTFIESIINAFQKDNNIVLHLDEVRNVNKKFHPFNYPSIDDVIGKGCINFKSGKTTGILDEEDPLHTRNYGACMSALRKDLINIGGADEHIDYLGHICGPYEMTFRLVNTGKRESWHQEEFLYHTWHPGTDGKHNYLGPHDGRNMSTTALNIIRSNRIMPLVENKAIETLRLNGKSASCEYLISGALLNPETGQWKINKLKRRKKIPILKKILRFSLKNAWIRFLLLKIILLMIIRQLLFKARVQRQNKIMAKNIFIKLRLAFAFIRRMWRNNIYAAQACTQAIQSLVSSGVKEAAIYGNGEIADMIRVIIKKFPLKIDDAGNLHGYKGKIIIASFTGIAERVKRLEDFGIEGKDIIKLQ